MIGLSVDSGVHVFIGIIHISFIIYIMYRGREWLEKLTRSNFFAIAMCKAAYGRGSEILYFPNIAYVIFIIERYLIYISLYWSDYLCYFQIKFLQL